MRAQEPGQGPLASVPLLSNEAEHSLTGQGEVRGKGQGEHPLAGKHSMCWGGWRRRLPLAPGRDGLAPACCFHWPGASWWSNPAPSLSPPFCPGAADSRFSALSFLCHLTRVCWEA